MGVTFVSHPFLFAEEMKYGEKLAFRAFLLYLCSNFNAISYAKEENRNAI